MSSHNSKPVAPDDGKGFTLFKGPAFILVLTMYGAIDLAVTIVRIIWKIAQ